MPLTLLLGWFSNFVEENDMSDKHHCIYLIIAEAIKDLSLVFICDTVPFPRSVLWMQFPFQDVILSNHSLDTSSIKYHLHTLSCKDKNPFDNY